MFCGGCGELKYRLVDGIASLPEHAFHVQKYPTKRPGRFSYAIESSRISALRRSDPVGVSETPPFVVSLSRTMNGVFTQSVARNDNKEAICHLERFDKETQGRLRADMGLTEPPPEALKS